MNKHKGRKQVLAVGGNSNNSANAGAWYWNSNNGSVNRNTNIGSQLSYLKKICMLSFRASWQNIAKSKCLVGVPKNTEVNSR